MFRKLTALCLISLVAACGSSISNDPANKAPAQKPDGGNVKDGGLDVDVISDAGNENPDGGQEVPSGFVYQHYDINHIMVTGQSNSVANSANPITFSQPYNNLSFNTGVMSMSGCSGNGCTTYNIPSSFIPLIEGDDFFFGGHVETASSGFANQVSKLHPEHTALVSLHGRSGNTYWCLRKGGCNYKVGLLSPFQQGMQEVSSGQTLAQVDGKTYIVRAVLAIHGESDHYSYTVGVQEFPLAGSDGTPNKIKDYADALLEWQADYEAGVRAITGQQDRVPLFVSGVSGWNDAKESRLAQMQLDAHNRSNGMVVLVGPGYPMPFQNDCLHYSSQGQRRVGEYFAKAYHKVIIEGKRWEPVHPKEVVRYDDYIRITYHVPVEPLAWDTTRISDPGNYGFEFTDDAGTSIKNIYFAGPHTVIIQLTQVPGNNRKLTYAQNQVPKTCIGVNGARGNLRDSDNTPSQSGSEMFNWAVPFIQGL